MRDRRKVDGSIYMFASLMLLGCGEMPKHRDLLVFGTNTKLALDVSPAPETGNIAGVTLGYKRQEFVLMPLLVNAADSRFCVTNAQSQKVCDAQSIEQAKYLGSGSNSERDAYSVFASFGATFSGGGATGKNEAQGGLAQFFATGLAAQQLASNPRVSSALSVKTEAAEVAAANALAMGGDALATPEIKAEATAALIKSLQAAPGQLDAIVLKSKKDGVFDTEAWGKLVEKSEGLGDAHKIVLKSWQTEAEVRSNLGPNGDFFQLREAVYAASQLP